MLALLISLILLWPAAQENYFSQGFAKNQFSLTLVIKSDASVMPGPDRASEMADQVGHDGEFDMDEYLYGHVVDAYDWHITTVNGKHISIPLLIIARSKTTGWHVFSSGKLAHGHEYEGFYLWHDQESHRDRLMEHTPSGDVRPLDISITKNVAGLLFNSLVLVLLVLFGVKWYRRHDAREEAPGGFSGLLEMLVMMVEDDIIKPCIGPDYKRYSPYLLTAFFFIFVNNLLGIVPFFPGGANITGNIAVTFMMAVFTFLAVNLMVRLFANILAGHMMILGVVSVVFLTASLGPAMNGGLSAIAVLFGVFMDVLELLVAFLQAYIFTMLSSVFIGLSRQHPEEEKAE